MLLGEPNQRIDRYRALALGANDHGVDVELDQRIHIRFGVTTAG
jgi:hypothetical protein